MFSVFVYLSLVSYCIGYIPRDYDIQQYRRNYRDYGIDRQYDNRPSGIRYAGEDSRKSDYPLIRSRYDPIRSSLSSDEKDTRYPAFEEYKSEGPKDYERWSDNGFLEMRNSYSNDYQKFLSDYKRKRDMLAQKADEKTFANIEVKKAELEPVKEDATKAESVPDVSNLVEAEPVKAAPVKAEPVKAEPVKAEPVKVEPVKVEPVKAEPVKVEPVKAEPVKAEPVKAEPVKAEPVKAEPVKAEPVKAEPVKAEPVKAEPVKAEKVISDSANKYDNLFKETFEDVKPEVATKEDPAEKKAVDTKQALSKYDNMDNDLNKLDDLDNMKETAKKSAREQFLNDFYNRRQETHEQLPKDQPRMSNLNELKRFRDYEQRKYDMEKKYREFEQREYDMKKNYRDREYNDMLQNRYRNRYDMMQGRYPAQRYI